MRRNDRLGIEDVGKAVVDAALKLHRRIGRLACVKYETLAADGSVQATTFSDGTVGSKTNALHAMFSGHVQWIAGFTDNYYEITDRSGHIFRWMSWTDIDDWSSCGRFWGDGSQDGSKRPSGSDDDDEGARITAGVPAMGAELTEQTIPVEAGQWLIDASVSFTKGCYTGQEIVAKHGEVPARLPAICVDWFRPAASIPPKNQGNSCEMDLHNINALV